MAKGQQRSNREPKKPKKAKAPVVAAAPSTLTKGISNAANTPKKNKKK